MIASSTLASHFDHCGYECGKSEQWFSYDNGLTIYHDSFAHKYNHDYWLFYVWFIFCRFSQSKECKWQQKKQTAEETSFKQKIAINSNAFSAARERERTQASAEGPGGKRKKPRAKRKRKGKERKGKERKGKERKGKKGKEGKEREGKGRKGKKKKDKKKEKKIKKEKKKKIKKKIITLLYTLFKLNKMKIKLNKKK